LKLKKIIFTLFLFYIIGGSFFCIMPAKTNEFNAGILNFNFLGENKKNEKIKNEPKESASLPPLKYSAFHRNSSVIRRNFQSVNFTLNVSMFSGANKSILQLTYPDNTVKNLTMTIQNGTIHNYTRTITPKYNDPLGFYKVKFLIYNYWTNGTVSNWTLLNNQTTSKFSNFTLIANCMVNFNSSDYYRNQYLLADLTILDYEDFDWTISIVDKNDRNPSKTLDLGANKFQVIQIIDDWFDTIGIYYLKINVSKTSNHKVWTDEYFQFEVINSEPNIIVSTVVFSPSSVYRTDNCKITLNVSDVEDNSKPEDITVKMSIRDTNGKVEVEDLTNNKDGSFKKTFSIDETKPIGNYRIIFTATDSHSGTDTYETSLLVKNNPPELFDYTINNKSMDESIEIKYGEDLIFEINATDVEGIAYIKVALLNEEDEWYNITKKVSDELKITVRTVELIMGVWDVYIFVTDTDGETIGLDFDYDKAPQQIRIIPDVLSGVIPWITFFFGLFLGILAGAGVGYYRIRNKIIKSREITRGKKKEQVGKQVKIKKQISKKRSAPLKSSLQEREPKGTDIKETEPKKEEIKPRTSERKIKRRL